ncbi:hypothetical protein AX16_001352 [Volvariella volvacea WC 439]|nr:hypothetical protein AX16_001352 [Volvariella volvacea WC 439]
MPPRRPSRSTRASVEPSAPENLPAKRKRGQTAEPEDEQTKPRSTRRASSSKPPSTSGSAPRERVASNSRAKRSLEEVPELENEEDEEPPAKKRSRPSTQEAEAENEEMEEDEVPKKRGNRGGAAVAKRGSRSSLTEDKPASARSSRRSSVAPPSTSQRPPSRSTRTARGGAKPQPVKEEDEDEDELAGGLEEEESQPRGPARGGRRGGKAASRPNAKAKVQEDSDESMDSPASEEEDEVVPPPKGRRDKVPAKKAVKAEKPKSLYEDDSDDSSDVDSQPERGKAKAKPKSKAKPPPKTPSRPSRPQPQEEEEEERSLFEAPPPPPPVPQPVQIVEEPKGPTSRLVIHKMALVNFKSYAGRQEIGPFHKSFSAIVGPNGSGKSNTIDALLFVFGYRATKMRQGKLSELIHNSDQYPDLQSCSVEVHFREIIDLPGPDSFQVVPGSQLVVARQAFKDSSSRYTINGAASNYKEVQALLKGRGIDLDHNRFLILQGEVESIAQMKPKASNEHEDGLLEYLEDIIGTSQYKKPIDEALVKMEELQEERQVKLNRLRVVEKDKAALEKQKKEAEDFLRLKNQLTNAQSRYYQWTLWKLMANEQKLNQELAKTQKELEEEQHRNKDDIAHLEMLNAHYKEKEQAYEEVKAFTADAVAELDDFEKREVNLQERRKHAVGKAKKLKKAIQEDTANKNKADHALEDNQEKLEKQKRLLQEHEASLEKEEKALEKIQEGLKDKTQVFHEKIEAKQRELQPWHSQVTTIQGQIDLATSERDALAKRARQAEEAIEEATNNLTNLQTDRQIKTKELEKLKRKKAELSDQLQAAETSVKEAQAMVQQLRGKATSARQRVDEARASQAANQTQNKVLDSLNKLKGMGRLSGFHGRLGSLGTIPDKYDVAITTACPSLNHLIVDKVDQGQECIEYLRRQSVGRASFMVLEKLSKSSGMNPIATPENVPRLFDLVKPKEPKFAPAFYKALGNTLVANDLDQANRIAYGAKRWRVVTLSGQLIDTSGTMSGGGTQVARGGMSSKLAADSVSPEVLRSYEQESEDTARKLEAAIREAREAEGELESLRQSGPQTDMELEKLQMDLESGKKQIAQAEVRVKELRSQNKPNATDVSRIANLELEISNGNAKLGKVQQTASKIEKDIKDLEQKILEIGGSRLMAQKSKVEGLKLHINLANDEITKAEVAINKAEKDSAKYEASIDNNSLTLREVEEESGVLESDLNELGNHMTKLRAKVKDAREAEENEKDDLDKLKEELDEKEENIQAFRQKEAELQRTIIDTQKKQKEADQLIEQYSQKHEELSLEEIDDDDEDEEGEEGQAETQTPQGEDPEGDGPSDDSDGEGDGDGDEDRPPKVKKEPTGKGKAKPEKTPSGELHQYTAQELARFNHNELVGRIELLDEQVKNTRVDLSVLREYRQREEEFLNRAKDLDKVTEARDAMKQEYEALRKKRLDEFMAGFNLISLKLKEMYQMITLGGNAELELVDSMDPFSEGIIFSVMPPKKSWKNISNLSGGEKTLSSLALVFALHVFKPTPLYFMDEIDAALDFRNVSIVANYIKDRTKNAQFIIISLRNDMFELSHRLIGIYKTSNQTRSISIDNHVLARANQQTQAQGQGQHKQPPPLSSQSQSQENPNGLTSASIAPPSTSVGASAISSAAA